MACSGANRVAALSTTMGAIFEFWCEGVLPSDDPLEGLRQWNIYFHVSQDGGRTFEAPASGDSCRSPIQLSSPTARCLDRQELCDGWRDDLLAHQRARWQHTPSSGDHAADTEWPVVQSCRLSHLHRSFGVAWKMTRRRSTGAHQVIRGNPEQSTRGMDEPTIEYLDGGRLLMVLRGSNDRRPELPSYRWFSMSHDGGKRWTPVQPWTYDDGRSFSAPALARNCCATPQAVYFGSETLPQKTLMATVRVTPSSWEKLTA